MGLSFNSGPCVQAGTHLELLDLLGRSVQRLDVPAGVQRFTLTDVDVPAAFC